MPHPRGLSSGAWIITKVALAKAGLIPGLQRVASATRNPQVFTRGVITAWDIRLDYATKPSEILQVA